MVGGIDMETKELMIGDWIRYSPKSISLNNNYGGLYRAEGVSQDTISLGTKNYRFVVSDKEIDSIPLTPEILEKNGFVLHGKTYILKWRGAEIHWRKTDGYASITAPNNLKLEGWCSTSNGYFCYVHILQHALRLCGLDELAENFRV